MNNVFFTGLLQAAKSDKVQFIAFAFCLVSVVFYCGFKIIAFYKARDDIHKKKQMKIDKLCPSEFGYSPFVFVIYDIESKHVYESFCSEGECIEYFETYYSGNDAFDWVAINIESVGLCHGASRGVVSN